jgi:hypothetical protein
MGLGTEEEEGYRTGPPGYIGWRIHALESITGQLLSLKIPSLGSLDIYKFVLRYSIPDRMFAVRRVPAVPHHVVVTALRQLLELNKLLVCQELHSPRGRRHHS